MVYIIGEVGIMRKKQDFKENKAREEMPSVWPVRQLQTNQRR